MLHSVRHPAAHRDHNIKEMFYDEQVKCKIKKYSINCLSKYFFFVLKVVDPFRWLENPDYLDTKQYIFQENDIAKKILESCSIRKDFIETISGLMNFERKTLPQIHGEHYFAFTKSGLKNHRYL